MSKSEYRVTEDLIRSKIKDVHYTILEDGKTTICNIYLENGFTVRGESACVDINNFDINLGEKYSYENAFNKLWLLEGYLMQEKMYRDNLNGNSTPKGRVENEVKDLTVKLDKLNDFKKSVKYETLSDTSKSLLETQSNVMASYKDILNARLNIWED